MRYIGFVYCLLRPISLVGLVFLFGDNLGAAGEVVVRRVSAFNGIVEGNLHVLTAEPLTLNGSARIDGKLIVTGTPRVRLNGAGRIVTQSHAEGDTDPVGWPITVNGAAWVQELVSRGKSRELPDVALPPTPNGHRDVVVNRRTEEEVDFTSARNVTLNGAAGEHAIPGGTYGRLTVNGRSVVVLGEAGATQSTQYHFQRLILNGAAEVRVVGPVDITLKEGAVLQGAFGNPAHPEWLKLSIARGGLTLNGQGRFFGEVVAPAGLLILNGGSQLVGCAVADRLILNGGSRIRVVETDRNRAPVVHLVSPAPDAHFVAPATVNLVADAHDPDGSIIHVDFLQGGVLLARDEEAPFEFSWDGLLSGQYEVSARAVDDGASSAESPVHRFVVAENQLPRVEMLTPMDGDRLYFPTSVTLQADASDPDGPVDHVEFFINGESVGQAHGSPYVVSWSISSPGDFVVNARVVDKQGASVDSESRTFQAIATVPDFSRFSIDEGFQPGALDGQLGWTGTGNALIEEDEETEETYVVLPTGEERASMSRLMVAPDRDAVVFIDLNIRPTAGPDVMHNTRVRVDAVELRFRERHGHGEILVFDPRSTSDGWETSGIVFPLADGWRAPDAIRLTLRLDRTAGVWDLYAEGVMVQASIPLAALRPMRTVLSTAQTSHEFTLEIMGPAFEQAAATVVSGVYTGWENPIAPDQDVDGIDDEYEQVNGMDLGRSDRDEDVDGDGLNNVLEYTLGTAAALTDTDGDSLSDAWEHSTGLDPSRSNPSDSDSDGDGLSDAAESASGGDPRRIDSDFDGITDGWEVQHGLNLLDPTDAQSDLDGDGLSNYAEFRKNTDPHDPLDGHELVIKPLLTASGRLLSGGRFKVRISRSDGQPLKRATVTIRVLDDANLLTDGIDTFREVTLQTDEQGIAEILMIRSDEPSEGDDDGGGVA